MPPCPPKRNPVNDSKKCTNLFSNIFQPNQTGLNTIIRYYFTKITIGVPNQTFIF